MLTGRNVKALHLSASALEHLPEEKGTSSEQNSLESWPDLGYIAAIYF